MRMNNEEISGQLSNIGFWTDKELRMFYNKLETPEEKEEFLQQLTEYQRKLDYERQMIIKNIERANYSKAFAIEMLKIEYPRDVIRFLNGTIQIQEKSEENDQN